MLLRVRSFAKLRVFSQISLSTFLRSLPLSRPLFPDLLITASTWRRRDLFAMFGFSYGQIFLLIGATAALIGPKDLPKIARNAGRLAGRAIGYVQMVRGQFDTVLQQSQASQVHKELQDAMAQLDAIRYEIRSLSLMNPGPMTRKLMDSTGTSPSSSGSEANLSVNRVHTAERTPKDFVSSETDSVNLQSQAATYSRFAASSTMELSVSGQTVETDEFNVDAGSINIIPISAERAGMLPKRVGDVKGSDIVLEAILEAEVAEKAKHFFAQPGNQIPSP